jgi:hypothetical protein
MRVGGPHAIRDREGIRPLGRRPGGMADTGSLASIQGFKYFARKA